MSLPFPDASDPGHAGTQREPRPRAGRPLVVDVEDVLLQTSLSSEAVWSEIAHRPSAIITLAAALLRGPAELKRRLSTSAHFDPARLAYNTDTVGMMLQVLGEGRPVYLASDHYDGALVSAIAQHLGVFTAWSASETGVRLDPEVLGLLQSWSQGFDYLGHDSEALPTGATRLPRRTADASTVAATQPAGWRVWAKLLRVHQWAKNALVLVPLLTAHQFGFWPVATALLAAVAFSLGASAAYILNDLVDVTADRAHATKRNRPIASGAIAPAQAIAAMALLLVTALALATAISLPFLGMLVFYLALTTAYSFRLKRIALVDVVTLAVLYTLRVIAGAVAIGVAMSEWLFAFSLFIFMALALVKRYVELDRRSGGDKPMSRDYQPNDLSMIAVLAAAAGFNAVVIFTLYISSDTVRALYSHPQIMWAGCPVLMYWMARVMLFAQRGLIDDDPVIFALKDRVSWLALGTIGAIMLAAM
ncbi:UbiA family prenyltransferase [Bradyrhizobium sp. HKCCYLR20261]|uniref:UbiA family prenyltransferase n=1 Tax=Bradyrhizobium sp. HKCCYLR20261 TaxID=3420760 RepID=UPI003EB7EE4B